LGVPESLGFSFVAQHQFLVGSCDLHCASNKQSMPLVPIRNHPNHELLFQGEFESTPSPPHTKSEIAHRTRANEAEKVLTSVLHCQPFDLLNTFAQLFHLITINIICGGLEML
jgi:hypothetical protein